MADERIGFNRCSSLMVWQKTVHHAACRRWWHRVGIGGGEFLLSPDRVAGSRTMGPPFSLWPDGQLPSSYQIQWPPPLIDVGQCIFLYYHPNDWEESERHNRFSPPTLSIWLSASRPSSLSAISHLGVRVAGCHCHAIKSDPRGIAEVFSKKNVTKGDLFSFSR